MAYIATSCFIKVKPAGGSLVTKTVSELAKMSAVLPCTGGKESSSNLILVNLQARILSGGLSGCTNACGFCSFCPSEKNFP